MMVRFPGIALLAVIALGTGMLGTFRTAHAEATKITFFIWAGSNQGVVPTEVIEAYRKAHPDVTIDILESNNQITYPKMVAARRTTPDSPLVDCGFFNVDSITRGDVDDMWESMDPAGIPNMANVLPQYARPGNRGVAYQMNAMGLLYNKNLVHTPPDSWAALWSPDYKGKVVMFDYDTRALAIAARLNGGSEKDIDAGFKVWGQHADNFRALVDSNDAVKNALASGDAAIAPWFSAISRIWIKEGAPFGFAIPKEGAIGFPLYLAIAKGVTPAQRTVCQSLINTLLDGKNAGRYGELTAGIPTVKNAVLSDAQRNDPELNIEVANKAIVLDYSTIAQNTADWHRRWDREVKRRMH
jgi:putative spermidine/putrescine transport system substrate-binding protein